MRREVQPRTRKGKYSNKKAGRANWKVIGFLAACLFSAVGGGAYMATHSIASAETVEVTRIVDKMPERIASLKTSLVQKVSDCERAGHGEDEGIIIFDSNAKASIGTLQFQKATVISYYKRLYGKDISGKDAVMIALDEDKAFALARDIIFTTKNGVSADWVNCSRKYNLQAQVDLIKQLEK